MYNQQKKTNNIVENIIKPVKNIRTSNEKANISGDKFEAYALTISTCTVITNLNATVNLSNLTRFVNIYDQSDPELDLKSGGLYNVEYYGNCARGETLTDKIKDEFNNQTTVKLKYWGFRNINIKIFANGKLQMTGLKYENEACEVANLLINIINNTKINILRDINDLIKSKKTIDFQMVYDNNTKKIYYYRKKYDSFLKHYNFNILEEYNNILYATQNATQNATQINNILSITQETLKTGVHEYDKQQQYKTLNSSNYHLLHSVNIVQNNFKKVFMIYIKILMKIKIYCFYQQ